MAFHLIRELHACQEISLSVLILNDGTLAERLRHLDVEMTLASEKQQTFTSLLSAARSFVNRHRPQIIHAHRYKENVLAGLAAGCVRRSRLLTTQHGLPELADRPGRNRQRLVSGLNRTLLRRRFDRVVGVSGNIREYFKTACKMPAGKLCVIHNGIDLPLQPVDSSVGNGLVVGSAGRMFPVKDYALMLAVAGCVARAKAGIRFELVGDGPLRPELEAQLVAQSLQDAFSLPGQCHDMSKFFSGLHIYINTSLHEGIPMSILEAMAHGLPVIAPDVGGIGEIIDDGIDGFLVKGREPEAFAALIHKLKDASLRRRIGAAAREKIRRSFSAEAMAGEYRKLYRELSD